MDSTMTAADVAIGLPTHYGVAVTYLGEDGERLLALTGDRRRALAAMNATVRADCGLGEFRQQFDHTTLTVKWGLFFDTCGCKHADPGSCRADLNGPVTCCIPDPDDDADPVEEVVDHHCPRPGLPPCGDEGSWWAETTGVTEATPGAVQFCMVRVD